MDKSPSNEQSHLLQGVFLGWAYQPRKVAEQKAPTRPLVREDRVAQSLIDLWGALPLSPLCGPPRQQGSLEAFGRGLSVFSEAHIPLLLSNRMSLSKEATFLPSLVDKKLVVFFPPQAKP